MSIFDLFKKETPAENASIPDEYDIKFELDEINSIADSYIRTSQKYLKEHAEKYVEYKSKKASGHDFAKDEFARMMAIRKGMENAKRFKDAMNYRYNEYQRGLRTANLMQNMAKFAESMSNMGDIAGDMDITEHTKTIYQAEKVLDRNRKEMDRTLSIFEDATFEDVTEYEDAAISEVEKRVAELVDREKEFGQNASTKDIVEEVIKELV